MEPSWVTECLSTPGRGIGLHLPCGLLDTGLLFLLSVLNNDNSVLS